MLTTAFILAAFLIGSIPFGLLVARAKGVDIRKVGSGNIGATNVGRALGRKWFIVVFLLDFLKGCGPVLGAGWYLGTLGRMAVEPADAARWLGVAVAAVLGHVFSPWLKFKGGKGVATGAGVMMGVFPALTIPAMGAFVVFLLSLRLGRYMSLASMCAGLSLPAFVAAWFHLAHRGVSLNTERGVEVRHMAAFLAFALLLGVMIVWTHRANIGRLRAGTEPRWVKKQGE
ncbi:glycerol-3-phosphate acyltransferase PlsY [Phycisphaerales bacterium]|nr:glycerol-3-phosphate acyltransferase PlsY [Phycisphaerales bacterium]